ncbi:exonuclease SbcC [Sphingopyxis sp. PAMC25046]|uniref:putative immunity protein n=1 Tax=Sphingopyxis sp. PAMC25046 TaxID=2565556 RepID=UPI00109E0BED|nr:exonuclease SbcC [Sphingopyxis sp. PAMC25046]QCB56540.1 exonuclease SbcC [Sphingopyxis sp. PAMC25046]
MAAEIDLDLADLREVVAYAVGNAEQVLPIFERGHASDGRPGEAIAAASTFACGGPRVKTLRDTAWAAHKAAQETDDRAASEAARAAMCAPAAAFLHPLARPAQVRHILGAAAHAARASELAAGDDQVAGCDFVERLARATNSKVIEILCRYPEPPRGGGRTGELLRMLDRKLRERESGAA